MPAWRKDRKSTSFSNGAALTSPAHDIDYGSRSYALSEGGVKQLDVAEERL